VTHNDDLTAKANDLKATIKFQMKKVQSLVETCDLCKSIFIFILLTLNAEISVRKANLISGVFGLFQSGTYGTCIFVTRSESSLFWTEKGSVVDLDPHSSAFI
jgi:hypothetical protein